MMYFCLNSLEGDRSYWDEYLQAVLKPYMPSEDFCIARRVRLLVIFNLLNQTQLVTGGC